MKQCKSLLFLSVLALLGAGHAMAEPQGIFGWWPGHQKWINYRHYNNYLENSKDTQNTQWNEEDWYVQDWVSQSKDGFTLIDGWFKTDILREQDEERGVPVIVVGPMFYHLSGFDKRRVMTTLDSVYNVTTDGAHPAIVLKDWKTHRDVGIYTKEGLQLE